MSDLVAALPLGSRVVVRARLRAAERHTPGGPSMTDAVGVLTAVDATHLVVETARGSVRIERALVVAAKQVPPKPSRRGAAHLALSVEDLQRVMDPAWGAVERERLGDWVLRASAGFTQRGNSTLPLGNPGRPLTAAVQQVERWYAGRGLPTKFVLSGPEGFDPGDDVLGALLLERGYTVGSRTLALTAARETVVAADPGGPDLTVEEELTEAWLRTYRGTRRTVPGATETVLRGSPRVLFASIAAGRGTALGEGRTGSGSLTEPPVALARLGIASGWAGLGAVWTDPAHRGQGLSAHLTAGLAVALRHEDVALLHLQVEHDNAVAIRLYRRLGFATHSSYAYLTASPKPT